MAGKHARLAASASERWINCPGSVRLIEQRPAGRTSREAAEGTLAHSIASEFLAAQRPLAEWLGREFDVDGHTIRVEQEMIDGVEFYVTALGDEQAGDQIGIELQLTTALRRLHPDLGGTADYVRYRPAAQELLVADLKYGAGVLVMPKDNKQLKVYALGAMLAMRIAPRTVIVRVVQPRIEHPEGRVRDFVYTGMELVEFGAQLVEAAKATTAPGAALTPGPWCKKSFCPAAATCPALEAYRDEMGKDDLPAMRGLHYEKAKLIRALDMIEPLKAHIKAVEELAYTEAAAGRLTAEDGWKLVAKRPVRKVVNEEGAARWAAARGIDPYEEPSLKSPAQLEKGRSKADKQALAEFVRSESSGTVLVATADPRPQVERVAEHDFAALPGAAEVAKLPGANLFD